MINFSEYMKSLHEDFDHADNNREFGEPTPTSKKDDMDLDNETVSEQNELGVDKICPPDSEGLDAAAHAANDFGVASDGEDTDVEQIFNKALDDEDFDCCEEGVDMRYFTEAKEAEVKNVPPIPEEVRKNLREAAEYILSVLDEEENYVPNGEDPDDHIDADGVDQNTVPAYPEEKDQFSNVDGLSDDFVDNDIEESATGWDDLF